MSFKHGTLSLQTLGSKIAKNKKNKKENKNNSNAENSNAKKKNDLSLIHIIKRQVRARPDPECRIK